MMLAVIVGATVILLVLILWRYRSPEFRRRSEAPKFQFLANLGVKTTSRANPPAHLTTEEKHDQHDS